MKARGIIGALLLFFTAGCSLVEPQEGSLIISVRSPNHPGGVSKPDESIRDVLCRVGLDNRNVFLDYMEKTNNSFSARIPGLEPAQDYYVLLHGTGGRFAEVICCAFYADIEIKRREEKTVTLQWESFSSEIITPAEGDTIDTEMAAFRWTPVTGAIFYDWALGTNQYFWPDVTLDVVEGTIYTLSTTGMESGTYYWKVRCNASWASTGTQSYIRVGRWSDAVSFTIE